MPNKVRARYGIEAVQVVPPFTFTDSQAGTLLARLSDKHGSAVVVGQLQKCAREYLWVRNQYKMRPTRAEQNVALDEVNNRAGELVSILNGLDKDTAWELLIAAKLPVRSFQQLVNQLDIIADAAAEALRAGKMKRGPRSKIALDRAVENLAALFERVSGSPFAHNPKEFTNYTGRPHSAAGKFVVEFFKIVDPTVKETSLSTAMAGYVKARQIKKSTVN
jgi:hypothetical protein